ncbi:MAG: glutathione S-transferase C-terminal domain-containing protein [Lachnospiraceae bacterium]|nr:glutathione S-transferase C-terminal domain-containing protein [Lachnospiraceae bacterium]
MAVVDHVTNGEIQSNGKFERQANRFVTPFGDKEGELPVEKDRYRLLWAPVCPWANRSIIVRQLMGLEDVISVGTLDPIRPDVPWSDWAFTLDEGDKDPVLGIHLLSEAYKKADPEYRGRFTVPAIVDLKTGAVVNNDYFKLTTYFETAWRKYHKKDAPELYPVELREDIDELNDYIFHNVNNGVYKAGFATSQEAYLDAYKLVFDAFDRLEERLSNQRFLFGDYITESDIRLYVTLARFDVAYYNGFRVNKKMLKDYPNLWGYARDLYAESAFGDNTNFEAIKKHYHLCCLKTNPNNILPLGPDVSIWKIPSGRERLSRDPEHKFKIEEQ